MATVIARRIVMRCVNRLAERRICNKEFLAQSAPTKYREECRKGEALARKACEDALDRYVNYVELAELTERQALAVALRVGLGPSGDPLPITAIASEFSSYFGAPVTRQYVSALIQRAKEKLSTARLMDAFTEDFPFIALEKLSDLHMSEKRARALVRAAVRQKAPIGPIDYGDVLTTAGVRIPDKRLHQVSSMTEEESMVALREDFGVTRFGHRAKICGMCGKPKPLSHFYKTKTHLGSETYSYMCRGCNTIWCGERRRRRRMLQI